MAMATEAPTLFPSWLHGQSPLKDADAREVLERLKASRLLVITGPAGSGKTPVAHAAALRSQDGSCWIDLSGLAQPHLVLHEIAQALGVREIPQKPLMQLLRSFLRPSRMLLVLDGCDGLDDACAMLAEDLLAACPELKILLTSRHAPARLSDSEYQVAPPVSEDSPASRVKAGIQRLEAKAALLLSRLAVFPGTFSAEEAAEVAAVGDLTTSEVPALLSELERHQLLRRMEDSPAVRHALPEPVRAEVRAALSPTEATTLEERLFQAALHWAELARSEMAQAKVEVGLQRARATRASWRWALAWASARPHSEQGLRLVAALSPYWKRVGQLEEGLGWARPLLARAKDAPLPVQAAALDGVGTLLVSAEKLEEARQLHEQALTLYRTLGDKIGQARTLNHLGVLAHDLGIFTPSEYERAAAYHEEAIALWRELDNLRELMRALNNRGVVAHDLHDYNRAFEVYREHIALAMELGDLREAGTSLSNMGLIFLEMGRAERARSLFESSLKLFRDLGIQELVVVALNNLASAFERLGDTPRAEALLEEARQLTEKAGPRWGEAIPQVVEPESPAFRRVDVVQE